MNSAPRICLSTSSVFPDPAEVAFELAADLGYHAVEVMVTTDPDTQDADRIRALSRRYRLPVSAIHAPCLVLTQFVWGGDPVLKLRRSVEVARRCDADIVVVHPPFRWQRDYAIGFADLVAELSGPGDVAVCVENMYPWRVSGRSVAAYAPGWDPREHDWEHVTLDVSHCAAAGVDSLEMADDLGDRLRHLHLTDGSGAPRDEHLVPGRGSQPVDALLRRLAETRFDGQFVLEVNTRRALTRAERATDIAASIAFVRTALLRSDRYAVAATRAGATELTPRRSRIDPASPASPASPISAAGVGSADGSGGMAGLA